VKYETEAIYITPPTGADQTIDGSTLDGGRGQTIPFTTSSGSPVLLVGQGWCTFTADQSVQIRHWKDNTLNANQASDFPLWQFAYLNYVVDGFLWVRLKGLTASGTLYYYPSNR
jgi:hypothetical protein